MHTAGQEPIDLHSSDTIYKTRSYSSGAATTTTTMSQPVMIRSNEAGPSTNSDNGKRAITARACDACRTRKLKCSGRPDTIAVNDAGVAIIPCEVGHSSTIWAALIGSIAGNGNWNAATCTSGNDGAGGIWWWRNWQNSRRLEGIVMAIEAIAPQGVKEALHPDRLEPKR